MAVINGNSGSNNLVGTSGDDTISGFGGNDTLNGGAGNDLLDGGTGNDSLIGGTGNDTLIGGDGTDTLLGGDGNDRLDGGAGNDSLDGGTGNDTLIGGPGADTLIGGTGLDFVDYSASDAAVNINLAAGTASGGHATGDVLSGVDGIIGSSFDDTLIGFDGQGFDASDLYTNIIFGGAGNDYIDGLGGDDSLYGGTGNDTILGGLGNDYIDGGTGADSLLGGAGNDTIDGGDGDDTIDGGSGADLISGGVGNDLILGGSGNDTIDGGAGNDVIDGGTGNDLLRGGDGDDTIDGGAGNDVIEGGAGNDLLRGGDGNDTIDGGAGNDTIIGGAGADVLRGGDGRDTFLGPFGAGTTVDGGEGGDDFDVLDLTGSGPLRVIYTDGDPASESGVVQFRDANGNITGTLTFSNIESVIACFAEGSRIATPRGEVAVEDLVPGDLVLTRDNGARPLRWIGRREVSEAELSRAPALRPVRFQAGALGNGLPQRDLTVSPQHRMLVVSHEAELHFGENEVLVAARHFAGRPGISTIAPQGVTYYHLLFDSHEIVLSNGVWSESFQPGERVLGDMDEAQRVELAILFPDLCAGAAAASFPPARITLRGHEAAVLAGLDAA